jgi:drug/metabolite transporter (DMT)-like permease
MKGRKAPEQEEHSKISTAATLKAGVLLGSVLFIAASLQQVGVTYSTAGKAAFITGLYIVFVPLLGIFLKQKLHMSVWAGVILAVIGLYLLCGTDHFSISTGDPFVLVGAIFWAVHILLVDRFTKTMDALKLSCVQFATCSVLSLITALLFERISWAGLLQGIVPILYGGLCSVGIAYTLQVFGQKHAKPSHAAIILSMEAVFAALFGLILLGELLNGREYAGCALVLAGMLVAQIRSPNESSNISPVPEKKAPPLAGEP